MLDSVFRPLIDPPLNAVARRAVRWGVQADLVTLAGLLGSLWAFAALTAQAYGMALAGLAISRLLDGLDGAVARHSGAGPTDRGAVFDIVSDFILYGGLPFFFAVGRPEEALTAAFLIFSFMGTAGSFLAYGLIAAKRGLTHERQGEKSFFYTAGLCEGSETIGFFALFCLWPAHFGPLALLFGILCWITTAQRLAAAARAFS